MPKKTSITGQGKHKDISKKVLEVIRKKDIKPKPKWEFLLKSWVIWGFCILTLALGAISTGIAIFLLKNNDWDIRKELDSDLLSFALYTLPHIWVVLLGIFLFVAYYNFRHTSKGYRFTSNQIITLGLILISSVGGALFATGVAQKIENTTFDNISFYKNLNQKRHMNLWNNPNQGLLSGTIISVQSNTLVTLKDLNGNTWNVIFPTLDRLEFPKEMSEHMMGGIPSQLPDLIQPNQQINIKGKISRDREFKVHSIRPSMHMYMQIKPHGMMP